MLMAGTVALFAQEFGFGEEETITGKNSNLAIQIGGELAIEGTRFVHESLSDQTFSDFVVPRLSVTAQGNKTEARIKLKLAPTILTTYPDQIIDEALLRIYVGLFTLDGGLIKVSWGKADSQGPLDVINPLKLDDLTITDTMEQKIARPLLRGTFAFGSFSKIEGIFIPWFEGNRLALDTTKDRWMPAQIEKLLTLTDSDGLKNKFLEVHDEMATLEHFQAGVRFTTTTGPVDWGLQYFYGYLLNPAAEVSLTGTFPNLTPSLARITYNRYHQAAFDGAMVIQGFNVRWEGAANITEDTKGDDPFVYNPALAYSIGFDRDLFWAINLNLQYNGSYRLFDDKVGTSFLKIDIEQDTDAFTSQITARLSQNLFNDTLKWEGTLLWGLQNEDYLFIPSLTWVQGDAELSVKAGIFGGNSSGQLGQFDDNDYVSVQLKYVF